jgi:hypothetical protein
MISSAQAAHAALAAFAATLPAEDAAALHADAPVRVVRLDQPSAYLLVAVRDNTGLRGIVQLDEQRGTLESVARIRDPSTVFLLAADEALELAKHALPSIHGWGEPYLAWRPCRESPNSLTPLWAIPHSLGTTFVTQSGSVFDVLTHGQGG